MDGESHVPDAGEGLVQALGEIVGPAGLLLAQDMAAHLQGARYGQGRALCVVRPASAQQVSRVVALCAERGVQVVPQGANTGLVGASTPDASGRQVVLSLNRLRQRCSIDAADRTVEVDAGFLLHELNERLQPHGLWFPVDLAADPSVGGMVASNTGGTRLLRHGDVRHNLLAVEAVLFSPPGRIVQWGRALRKDNTGFDLKQLLVGTNGAGGVITGATFEVAVRPRQTATALLVPASDEAVLPLLTALESELGDFLSAFEGLSRNAMQAAIDHVPSLRNPLGNAPLPEFALLVELSSCGSAAQCGVDLEEGLTRFLGERLGEGVTDAVLGRGDDLWRLRHSLSDGARALGRVIGMDIAVRRSDLMRVRREAAELLARDYPQLQLVDFGHIGDGGLHLNLVWPQPGTGKDAEDLVRRVRDDLYQLVVHRFQGSYSAEHGIGPHNEMHYRRFTPPATLALSGRLQALLDPQGVGGTVRWGSAEEVAAAAVVEAA